jgi:hypothetical protein
LVAAAIDLPNIDGRTSVLDELPADTFLPDRGDYAVGEVSSPRAMEFGHPRDQDWSRCHPDKTRYRKLLCIKDKSSRVLRPITASLVNTSPRLQMAARPHIVRQAKILDGPDFLWAAPWPGGREFPGDQKARQAQEESIADWVKIMWIGSDWEIIHTDPPNVYEDPEWSDESFDSVLHRGLVPLLLHNLETTFIRRFLGLGR